jgi:hypothetical protein
MLVTTKQKKTLKKSFYFIILSIIQYSKASSADIKLSLSQSFSTFFTSCPVCFAIILYKVSQVFTMCSAANFISTICHSAQPSGW